MQLANLIFILIILVIKLLGFWRLNLMNILNPYLHYSKSGKGDLVEKILLFSLESGKVSMFFKLLLKMSYFSLRVLQTVSLSYFLWSKIVIHMTLTSVSVLTLLNSASWLIWILSISLMPLPSASSPLEDEDFKWLVCYISKSILVAYYIVYAPQVPALAFLFILFVQQISAVALLDSSQQNYLVSMSLPLPVLGSISKLEMTQTLVSSGLLSCKNTGFYLSSTGYSYTAKKAQMLHSPITTGGLLWPLQKSLWFFYSSSQLSLSSVPSLPPPDSVNYMSSGESPLSLEVMSMTTPTCVLE